jgi:hypothetical protein
MKNNTVHPPEEKNLEANSQTTDEMNRREALARLGKLAVYTTPVMTTLIISNEAEAQFSSPPGAPVQGPLPPGRPTGTSQFPNIPPSERRR